MWERFARRWTGKASYDRATQLARQREIELRAAEAGLRAAKIDFANRVEEYYSGLDRLGKRVLELSQTVANLERSMQEAWKELKDTIAAERDFQRAFVKAVEGWMTKVNEAPDLAEVRQLTNDIKGDIDEWRRLIEKNTPVEGQT